MLNDAFDEYVVSMKNEDPTFTYTLQGNGTKEDPYQIGSVFDVAYVKKISGYNSNKHYILTCDIYINDGKFVKNEDSGQIEYHAGPSGKYYSVVPHTNYAYATSNDCTIDGKGFSIYNFVGIYWTWSMNRCTLKNINFVDSYIVEPPWDYGAAIAANMYNSIIENVSISGYLRAWRTTSTFTNGATNTQFLNCTNLSDNTQSSSVGICGTANNCFFDNCKNFGKVLKSGLIGTAIGTTKISNCYNDQDIAGGSGICATAQDNVEIVNCENKGIVACGINKDGRKTAKIINCRNYANCSECGIAGSNYSGAGLIENCVNYGNCAISGIGHAVKFVNCINYGNCTRSGICCQNYGSGIANITIVNCVNYGRCSAGINCGTGTNIEMISCKNFGKCSAGISSYAESSAVWRIINCENYGKTTYGICSVLKKSGLIQKCVNYGIATYGICGTAQEDSIIQYCFNEGQIINGNGAGICGTVKGSAQVLNCLNKCELKDSTCAGIVKSGISSIKNSISIHKIGDVETKEYYGSDFSAFFVKWKTGYIGLKALESAGVYMFAIPDEEYLQQIGYTKMN